MRLHREDAKKTYRLRGAKPGMVLRWLVPVVIVIIGAMGFMAWKWNHIPVRDNDVLRDDQAEQEQRCARLALDQARAWSTDAVLAKRSSSVESPDRWSYEFGSATKSGKILRIMMNGSSVQSTEEIEGVVSGGVMPTDLISSEEAKARARAIPGYENVQVTGVEMIYGPDGKQWYWGVKTNRGVVSIKATK